MRTQFIPLLSAFALLTNNAGAAINKQLSDDMLNLVDHFDPNPTIDAMEFKLHQIPQVLTNVPEKIKIRKGLLFNSLRKAVKAAREHMIKRKDKWLIAMLLKGTSGHYKLYRTRWTPYRIFERFSLHDVEDKESHQVYQGYLKYFDQWKEWNAKL